MKKATLSLAMTAISLLTVSGVFVHGVHASSFVPVNSAHAASKSVSVDSDAHTHPTAVKSPINGFSYQDPGYPPRDNRQKKYMMQNYEPRGRHAFDNHHLPVID